MELEHYFVPSVSSRPSVHRLALHLDTLGSTSVERDTGMAWCSFRRILDPASVFELNLGAGTFYHFYFAGFLDNESV